MTISSNERPNIVFGSTRLIHLRWRISRSSSRAGAASIGKSFIAISVQSGRSA